MTPITLPKDLEDWARAEVAAGRAASLDDLIALALEDRRAAADDIKALLDDARAQGARGEAVDAATVIIDLRRRAAALRARAEAEE